jgi:hypothetical protein
MRHGRAGLGRALLSRCHRQNILRELGANDRARPDWLRIPRGDQTGYFKKGISRGNAKELGDLIDAGQATLLVIGESRLEEQLDKVLTRAEKTIEKEMDVDSKEFKHELEEAEKEYTAA